MKKQVLSCIQPSGEMHLGNYFGAVKNWVELQEDYDCIYGVVDLHAMTASFDPVKLRVNTWNLVMDMVAVGIKPENIFIQSLVPEHAELNWIFNCFCSYGQLTRMTQFKDKSRSANTHDGDHFISAGLLSYPVLQAADILIYRADYVPVGRDQEQHLELTRNIAQRFNNIVGQEYFVLPESLFTATPKICSTADPSRKMSKSAGAKHVINVFEDEGRIRKQIRSAVTDTGDKKSGEMSPGVNNLFELLRASDPLGERYNALMGDYENDALRYSDLKEATAESLVALLHPFKERREELKANKKELKGMIKESSARIRKRAVETVRQTKELVGLLNVKY